MMEREEFAKMDDFGELQKGLLGEEGEGRVEGLHSL